MHVPEINEVKEQFEAFKKKGLIEAWELPYENLLTRRSAAIFFFTTANGLKEALEKISAQLGKHEDFSCRVNNEKKLSQLQYRVTFSKEEKDKNQSKKQEPALEVNGLQ